MKLRRCEYTEYRGSITIEGKGLFHQFSVGHEVAIDKKGDTYHETTIGHAVAIIELEDGRVKCIPADQIKFIDGVGV